VRQSGVTCKRSYREWTKTEQQKLLDLIASHSLHEVTVLLRRRQLGARHVASARSQRPAWARIGSRNTPWRKRCMFARKRCRSGLIVDVEERSCRQAGSKDRLLTRRTFAISASDTAEKSWDEVEYRSAEFCPDICFSAQPHGTVARPGIEEGAGGVRRTDEEEGKLFGPYRTIALCRHTQSISNGWYRWIASLTTQGFMRMFLIKSPSPCLYGTRLIVPVDGQESP